MFEKILQQQSQTLCDLMSMQPTKQPELMKQAQQMLNEAVTLAAQAAADKPTDTAEGV